MLFGKPSQNGSTQPNPARPAAADVARIQGGGLVQVIVTDLRPMTFYLFLNDKIVPQMDVESLSISIEAPDAGTAGGAIVRATLSRYAVAVNGERNLQRTELFPSTIEIVAVGRRISLTSMNADSLDNLWISLGLKVDGTSGEVSGAKSVRFLLTEGILDAKLTWMDDGTTEDLLPQ